MHPTSETTTVPATGTGKPDGRFQLLRNSGLFEPDYLGPSLQGDLDVVPERAPELVYLSKPRYWSLPTSPFFHGRYYLQSNRDVADAKRNPLVHYVRAGYAQGRSPSPVIDVAYILQQLASPSVVVDRLAFEEFQRTTLSSFHGIRELLEQTRVNPNPFFDNDSYVRLNRLGDVGPVPLEHYLRAEGRANDTFLQCSPHVDLVYYMDRHPDLVAGGVIPLMHLLEYGLKEGREFLPTGSSIQPEFLQNSATLYGDPRLVNPPGFIARSAQTGQLAGPTWPSAYATTSLPALAHTAPRERRKAFVGVVLYENTDEQLRRLEASINRERVEHPDYAITVKYLVNDAWNLSRYTARLGDPVEAAPSRENIGFGRGHNHLMRQAFDANDLYIGANPDGYFTPSSIKVLIDFADYYAGAALVEASALPIDHPKWHDPVLLDTQWVSGACFALSRPMWEKTGGFDEDIHMYCEDVDLSWRVRLAGGLLKVCPTARFVHDVTPRFTEDQSAEEAQRRRKHMLAGGYYLAVKWGNAERAAHLKAELGRLAKEDAAELLQEPKAPIPAEQATRVADFENARFAPSRFW